MFNQCFHDIVKMFYLRFMALVMVHCGTFISLGVSSSSAGEQAQRILQQEFEPSLIIHGSCMFYNVTLDIELVNTEPLVLEKIQT